MAERATDFGPANAGDRPRARYWTVRQLARRWADQGGPMPASTIYGLIQRGELKAKRFGARLKVAHAEVLRYEAAENEPAVIPMGRAVSSLTLDALATKWGL